MCGIAGYVCKDQYEPKLDMVLPLLGVFMDTRGGDSWGYTNGKRIHKQIGELQKSFTPEFVGAKEAAIHTRYGTTGAKTAGNSHPWRFGSGDDELIGMHNGVVYNHEELQHRLFRKFEVDSQHIFQHIVEQRDLSEIEAYGAIVFWRNGLVHLGRFNGGSLAIARAPWGIVFASTDSAIEKAFQIAGLPEPIYYNVVDGELFVIENGLLYTTEIKLDFSDKPVEPAYWQRPEWASYSGAATGTASQGWLTKTGPSVVNGKQHYKYNVTAVDGEECAYCLNKLDPREAAWDTADGMLCDSCANEYYDFDGVINLNGNTAEKEDDDPYEKMTIREFEQILLEDHNLPLDHPSMASCDECHNAMNADDTVFVDDTNLMPWILCSICHAKSLSRIHLVTQ